MNKRQYRSIFLTMLVAVLSLSSMHARAQTTPCVSLEPKHIYIEPPEACTLYLILGECIDSLSCMECIVAFDTSIVSLESIEEGQLFAGASFPTFFKWERPAPDTGSVIDCVLGYQSYVLPPGELARFVFRAKQTGVCPVRITSMKLWDISREPLQAEVDSCAYIHNTVATGVHPIGCPEPRLTCYPNPFNPCTLIILNIPDEQREVIESNISLSIYSPAGRMIRSLYKGLARSGANEFLWDGSTENGNPAQAGVYFAAVNMNDVTYTRKLILVR
jgi:hypothetical protein